MRTLLQSISDSDGSFRVMGVDPGLKNTGSAVLQYKNNKLDKVLHDSLIRSKKDYPERDKIYQIGNEIDSIIDEYEVNIVGVESIFWSKNVTSALSTAKIIGVVNYISVLKNLPCFEINPQTVKKALGFNRKSNKKEIKARVELLTGIELGSHHTADAIGVAIACFLKLKSESYKEGNE